MIQATQTALIVPIRVTAMPISAGDATNAQGGGAMAGCYLGGVADFAKLAPTTGSSDTPYVSATVAPPLMNNGWAPPQGVHLHWNLPAALRGGSAEASGLTMPTAPNRWLVTRVTWGTGAEAGATPVFASWLVQSDALAAAQPPQPAPVTTIPLSPAAIVAANPSTSDPVYPYQYLGAITPLTAPVAEPAQALPNLTAVGYGIADFASYLPNCYNVFGMLDNPGPGGISYVVLGWYDDLANDPVSPTYTAGGTKPAGAVIPATWSCDTPDTTATQSIYFGTWSGLDWTPGSTSPLQGSTPWTTVCNLSVGNSPFEALSALIAGSDDSPEPNAADETLINALQSGLLQGQSQHGFTETVAKSVFHSGFSQHGGGHEWLLRDGDGLEAPETPVPPSPALNALVAALNAQEAVLDDALGRQQILQTELYVAWYLYQQNKTSSNYSNLLSTLQSATSDAAKSVSDQTGKVAAAQNAAATQAAREGRRLMSAPRAHRAFPADHTLLLSGNAIPPLPADFNAQAALPCFTSDALATAALQIAADLVPNSGAGSLAASALVQPPSPANIGSTGGAALVVALGPQLIQAALLVDPLGASYLANQIATSGAFPGGSNPAALDLAGTVQALASDLPLFVTAGGQGTTALSASYLPDGSIGFGMYQPGTLGAPIILGWECAISVPTGFYGADNAYQPDAVVSNYQWTEDGLELELKSPDQAVGNPYYWQGSVPLSPNITFGLVSQLKTFLQYNSNQQVEELVQAYADVPLLAQTISGFHRGLGMLQPSLQLPVFDIYRLSGGLETWYATLNTLIGSAPRFTPQPGNLYTPIRGGTIALKTLTVIDEFGRVATISPEYVHFPSTIAGGQGGGAPSFQPTLRFAQPSRMEATVLERPVLQHAAAAADAPAPGPLRGWIVPNMIDGGLMFYTAEGDGIGTLLPGVDRAAAPIWIPAPDLGLPTDTMATSFGDRSPVLAEIANAIVAGATGYLADMFTAIVTALKTVMPPVTQTDAISLLVGTPLAVVQARLALGMPGGVIPAPAPVTSGENFVMPTLGVTQVQFPVHLGSPTDLADGLAGFFSLQGTGDEAYATFYSEGAPSSSPQVVLPRLGTPYLTIGDEKTPAAEPVVTVLFDPRCAVRVINGMSPPATLALPPSLYGPAVSRMAFSFLAAPVITQTCDGFGSGPLRIPTPRGVSGSWTMVGVTDGAWQNFPVAAIPAAKLPLAPVRALEGWLKFKKA